MDQKTFMGIVAKILEVDEASLSTTDILNDIDWDSLATISFIADVDSALGVSVDADLLARALTVGDLYSVVTEATARGASAGS
jgi:acyl carrier protein